MRGFENDADRDFRESEQLRKQAAARGLALIDRDRLDLLKGGIADLMLAGNRLARGEGTVDEWNAAVAKVAGDPVCVYHAPSEDPAS